MKITDPIEFIKLGGRIRYLAGRQKGDPIYGHNYILNNLNWVRDDLDRLGFPVSCNLFDVIIKPIISGFEENEELADENEDLQILDENESKNLVITILQLESTVLAEAATRVIASPVPRRFSLDHLLENPGGILGAGVFELLTDLAQSDVSYTCKCIAFECPTAAAFHMLRAVEECVRVLFKAYFPRGDEKRPWGTLTEELKLKPRKPKPDDTLIAHLDHLRVRFRNPTDHPEKIYEIEEAEDLVHISVDIINRSMRDTVVVKKRT